MKADITKKSIDVNLIKDVIEKYMCCTNCDCKDIYIIMSYETLSELKLITYTAQRNGICTFSNFSNSIKTYHGCRIAIDDSLKFGEIDIR